MSTQFSELLAIGGKTNSLGRAKEVVEAVLGDRDRLKELFECLHEDDAWLRMRAIDSIEKVGRVNPGWLEPYAEYIVNDLTKSTQPSIQWHLAQMFQYMTLTSEQKQRVITWLNERLSDDKVDWIAAAYSMDALAHFTRQGLFPKQRLQSLLMLQQRHHSKSVVKRASKLLSELSD